MKAATAVTFTKSSMNRLMVAEREKVPVGKDCLGPELSK